MFQPHWLIAGAHTDTGVVVVASDQLSQMQLTEEAQRAQRFSDQYPADSILFGRPPLPPQPEKKRYRLSGTMLTVTIVTAADFPTALAHLFREWSPGESPLPEPPGLTPARELPAGVTDHWREIPG